MLEPNDPGCFYDSITFYEGEGTGGNMLGRVCGNQTNVGVRSNRNVMAIKFKADESGHGRGFRLKWGLKNEIKERKIFLTSLFAKSILISDGIVSQWHILREKLLNHTGKPSRKFRDSILDSFRMADPCIFRTIYVFFFLLI